MRRADVVVQRRNETGKGAARSARRMGKLPAIVYGGGAEAVSITVDRKMMAQTIHGGAEGESVLINMKIEGEGGEILTLIRDTQHNPLTGEIEHLDFLRVSLDRPITTSVLLHPVGTAKGVKEGGVFEMLLREIEIECLPLDIPSHLEIDIMNLEMGHTLHVSDIPPNPKYKILTALDRAAALVAVPKKEVAPGVAEAAAEAAAAEGAEGEEKKTEEKEGE